MRTRGVVPFVALVASSLAGCDAGPPAPTLALPPRPPEAPTAARLADELAGLEVEDREERIFEEVAAGNVPTWSRELRPIRLERELDGRTHEVVFWVAVDYLAVGSDDDYLLVPMSPRTAQRIADMLSASLPTPLMVDAVWSAADVRLAPQRLSPRDSIGSVRSVEYFLRHTNVIAGQRRLRGAKAGALVAGHKKDVVIADVVAKEPGKVAVYGMHGRDGVPTQALSTVAGAGTIYYNHGVRLVHGRVTVDGADMSLARLLRDPTLAPLLSARGPISDPRYPTADDPEPSG